MFDRSDEKQRRRPTGATAAEARRFGEGLSLDDMGLGGQRRSDERGVSSFDRLIEVEPIVQRQVGVVLRRPGGVWGMLVARVGVVVFALPVLMARRLLGATEVFSTGLLLTVMVGAGKEVMVVQPPGVDMVPRAQDLLSQPEHRHHGQ